ncbi:hypothetical protein JQ628_13270 [Bradyrhizobium lablabi]|uniref:hypothetical protein n=1 Tax=Bradyrhizobium lablabi TaxID=722472 RepID=UPI001BAD61D6|nr:hypothetical protein [Bradyrhizobium lablabi]MBR1122491.1 hypothetical protein [Bradyrhizobium lablabi]
MLFSRVKVTYPQDAPAIAPDVVPLNVSSSISSTWADKVLADITRDTRSVQPEIRPSGPSHVPPNAVVAAPTVDTTFRPTAVKPPPARSKWLGKVTMIFMFALVSACATGIWKHYGGSARQMIAEWTPLISEFMPQFGLASSPPAEAAAPAEQTASADQADSTDQAAAPVEQAAAADQAAPATSPATSVAAPAAAAALPPESAELIQSMQRDLAALGQQVEQLKASIAELKANQPPVPLAARATEAKPAEVKPPAPAARPRVTAVQPPPPPRPVAPPPVRRPPPVQASAAPMQLSAQPAPPPAPPPPQTADDGGPVVRPPMSLRWNGVND